MLDEKKLKAIELLVAGEHTKTDIAKICGMSRRWLYDIIDDPEVVAEMHRQLHKAQLFGENKLKATINDRINDLIILAKTAESERVRMDAAIYLTNRVLGNTTTKLDITAESKQPEVVDFEAELDNITVDIESEVDSEE